ncbi:helix-turn-helix domain-containing protein [Brachybacterium tyrofermentans]|uniref:helix-turn-helix domain-containing protein n=1 Tax=Brachybacterium tyrofermentans TaxID=47848 RepID=UPI001869600D|nr:helix-turn-helix domain-containing protein [Brachybacterium tyrofermentans]
MNPLITLDDAAEMLAVNTRTIRRYVSAGDLPAFRLGPRHIRVKHDDVLALLVPVPTA